METDSIDLHAIFPMYNLYHIFYLFRYNINIVYNYLAHMI
jgi:hypothetical protein